MTVSNVYRLCREVEIIVVSHVDPPLKQIEGDTPGLSKASKEKSKWRDGGGRAQVERRRCRVAIHE